MGGALGPKRGSNTGWGIFKRASILAASMSLLIDDWPMQSHCQHSFTANLGERSHYPKKSPRYVSTATPRLSVLARPDRPLLSTECLRSTGGPYWASLQLTIPRGAVWQLCHVPILSLTICNILNWSSLIMCVATTNHSMKHLAQLFP